MLGFLMDRRGLAVSAAFITSGTCAFLFTTYPAWKAAIGDVPSWQSVDRPAEPAPTQNNASLPAQTPVAAATFPTGITPPAKDQSANSPHEVAQSVADGAPTFDVVRVEPTGESVIAARTKPGADLVLLDEGKPIARAKADASGQVAFIPPTLAPGEHSLMLSIGEPGTPNALSSQSVAVSVPEQPKSPPMVALIQPDQPTRVLSGQIADTAPVTDQPSPGAGRTTPETPQVAIRSVEVEEMGSFYATGKASPGSHCRVYLNGSFVATVTAGQDGAWSLQIKRGMKPGHYIVRADQIDSAAGQVQARAEVPFDYPTRLRAAASLLRPKAGKATPLAVSDQTTLANAVTPSSGAGKSLYGSIAGTNSIVPSKGAVGPAAAKGSGQAAEFPLGSVAASTGTGSRPSTAVLDSAPISPTIIAQLLTTKVVHGDSLWRISRKMLGSGVRYTQIYAANTQQIRDPRWIYPGQIFVMPQTATP